MMDDLTLLRGAFAVALADGELRRSEKGVLQGLAARAGVGKASFDAMFEAAERGEDMGSAALMSSPEAARAGLELLVAEARIDGEISIEEREVLVRIALDMGIQGDEFQAIYTNGVERADTLRKARGHG
jgi:tellurite resistance protein